MKASVIQKGFVIAGLSNIVGVLILSKAFTNQAMLTAQPEVMGKFGLIAIMLWGFAYIAVSKSYYKVPWLLLVFVIEKLVYVIVWLLWQNNNSLSALYDQDTFAGIFYTIYGVNDFLFMLFFGYVFWKAKS
ncbi:hypothetical protein ACFQ1Q_05775 [Winogradskyella litorisediminis]|uniref:Uncharacterized protein n=1 Tax=Winogradskyella litorisediminis TaxID=1156618 RepID=A0ABW3N4W3_9FLAO